MHYAQGEHDEALAAWQDALRVRVASLGLEHPSVADTLYSIGQVYEDWSQYESAADNFERCTSIYAAAYGPDHSETLDARHRAESARNAHQAS